MSVTRTIEINDLTPAELAQIFTGMCGNQQAEFFAAIRPIAATWPGAGWCQQSCDIVTHLNSDGRFVVETLAGHMIPLLAAAPRMASMIRAIADGTIPTTDEGYSQAEARRIVAEIDGTSAQAALNDENNTMIALSQGRLA